MIETIKAILDLLLQFINAIFNFEVDFVNGQTVKLGYIVVSFIFIITALYLILRAIGIKFNKGSDEDA